MSTERTPLFLMANLGAEVTRLLSAKESKNSELVSGALVRARNMINEIKKFPEMTARLAEINLLENAILDIASDHPHYNISPKSLKAYFTPFSMRLLV